MLCQQIGREFLAGKAAAETSMATLNRWAAQALASGCAAEHPPTATAIEGLAASGTGALRERTGRLRFAIQRQNFRHLLFQAAFCWVW
jgi:hypothetical protein